MPPDLTCDAFLGGQLHVWQPKKGYRAGVDPVLLAASIPAKPGQSVLELGCGVGVASLCLAKRVAGLSITGLELQESYAELARKNASDNAIDLKIIEGNLTQMPDVLRQQSFDHVMANPPYFPRAHGTPADDAGRETAMGEGAPLSDWVKAASKRLAPKGTANFVIRADRLTDLLSGLQGRLGSVQILPLVPREGRDARLVLVRAKKGGRAAMRLHDSIVMHQGSQHQRDEEDYAEALTKVLRLGQELPFPD